MHENAEENSELYLKSLEKAGKWILSAAGFKCCLIQSSLCGTLTYKLTFFVSELFLHP